MEFVSDEFLSFLISSISDLHFFLSMTICQLYLCTIAGHPVSHQEQHPDPVGPIWATLPSPLPSGSSRLSIDRVTSPRSSPTLSSEPGVSRCLILNWASFLQVKIQLFTAFLPTTAEICPRYELHTSTLIKKRFLYTSCPKLVKNQNKIEKWENNHLSSSSSRV